MGISNTFFTLSITGPSLVATIPSYFFDFFISSKSTFLSVTALPLTLCISIKEFVILEVHHFYLQDCHKRSRYIQDCIAQNIYYII